MFFHTDCGRMSFLMKLGTDQVSRIVAKLLVFRLKNPIFA